MIVWHDVLEDVPRWGDGTEGLKPVTVYTVGAVLERTKSHIVVARDIYWDVESGSLVTGGRLALPKGMIISQEKVGEIHAPDKNSGRGVEPDNGGQAEVLRQPVQKSRRHRGGVVGNTGQDGDASGGGPVHGVAEDSANRERPEVD